MGDKLDEKQAPAERARIAIRRLSIGGLTLTMIGVTGAAIGFSEFAFVVGIGILFFGSAGIWLALVEHRNAASNRKSHG